jgi:uncharacterized protein DUF1566
MRNAVKILLVVAAVGIFGCDDEGNPLDCDGGRFDENTGICWQHPKYSERLDWDSAIEYCDSLELGGHTDWFLPSIRDIMNLLGQCDSGVLAGRTGYCEGCDLWNWPVSATCSALFGPEDKFFWSSSTAEDDSTSAWNAHFLNGFIKEGEKKNSTFVRCVRIEIDKPSDIGPAAGDVDADADTDSDVDTDISECAGGRYEPVHDLCWQRPAPEGKYSWQKAKDYCDGLEIDGNKDWYLPGKQDFMDMLQGCESAIFKEAEGRCLSCYDNSACRDLFGDEFLEGSFDFWSSTTLANYTSGAWCVFLDGDGGYLGHCDKKVGFDAMCVHRGL